MSLDDKPGNPRDADLARKRRRRVHEILEGALPTTEERLAAYPPCRDSEAEDRRLFVQSVLLRIGQKLVKDARDVLELAAADGTIETLRAARQVLLGIEEDTAARRLQLYASLAGDTASAWPLGGYLVTARSWRFEIDAVHRVALGISLLALHPSHESGLPVSTLAGSGLADLRTFASWTHRLDAAEERATETETKDLGDAKSEAESAAGATARTPLDDEENAETEASAALAMPTMEVVPPFESADKKRTGAAKEVLKQLEPIAGQALPMRKVNDPAAIKSTLIGRFPHFAAELDLVLTQPLPWRLLLLGEPGCGKTELARTLAEAADLPLVVYGCAGVADGSFGGTSAQWASARPSVPLQLIQRTRVANPVVVLDELDKTDTDRRNGALVDVLLTFLEPASAKRVMDLGLELEVNLSAVSYLATANKIEDVPAPLRDRFRSIRMPSPGHAHVSAFVSNLLDDVAAERGLDRRWLTGLAQDEEEMLREVWPGGSLRRLKRILELLVDGRDRLMGRA